ncbi:hypothetical protein BH10PLA2_BH10PLA2_16860 [soil metagenome]
METSGLNAVIRHVRRVVLGSSSDEELLLAIASRRDSDAFEVLLKRHGPMVWAVCRRVLRQTQDAEDAFQATFLVLIRKAGAIRKRTSLPSWLHGVAYRTSRKAVVMRARRLVHESQTPARVSTAEVEDHSDLDLEVNALPEKYRLPVLLCELQGRTRKEAAEMLKIPEGTLSSRLAAARKTLAQRLRQRGACFMAGTAAPTSVPGPLVLNTVKTVGLIMTGGEAAGVVSANAIVLSQGVMQMMFFVKLKSVVLAAVAVGVLGIGAGKYAQSGVVTNVVAGDESAGKAGQGIEKAELIRLQAELRKMSAKLDAEGEDFEKLKANYLSAQKAYKEVHDTYQKIVSTMTKQELANASNRLGERLDHIQRSPNTADQQAALLDLKRLAAEVEHAQAQLQAAQQLKEKVLARYKLLVDTYQADPSEFTIPDSSDPKALVQKLKEAIKAYDLARSRFDPLIDSYKLLEADRYASAKSTQSPSKEFGTSMTTIANQFKYQIPVKIHKSDVSEGSNIEILEIWGTKPKFQQGGQYLVRAKYTMPTRKRGKLYFYESTNAYGGIATNLDLQSVETKQGTGEVSLLHGMVGPGMFHLQLLADDGGKHATLADVYFE